MFFHCFITTVPGLPTLEVLALPCNYGDKTFALDFPGTTSYHRFISTPPGREINLPLVLPFGDSVIQS